MVETGLEKVRVQGSKNTSSSMRGVRQEAVRISLNVFKNSNVSCYWLRWSRAAVVIGCRDRAGGDW